MIHPLLKLKTMLASFNIWLNAFIIRAPKMAVVAIILFATVLGGGSYGCTRAFIAHRVAIRKAYCEAQPLNCTIVHNTVIGRRNAFRTDHDARK